MKPKLSATATAGWNIGDDFRRYARSDGFALGVVGVSQEIAGLRDKAVVLHFWSSMKTATVRELRNRYTQLLEWIDAGEEIRITRRGVVIARLVPENRARAHSGVDWSRSAAFALDRLNLRPLKAELTAKLLDDNKGPF